MATADFVATTFGVPPPEFFVAGEVSDPLVGVSNVGVVGAGGGVVGEVGGGSVGVGPAGSVNVVGPAAGAGSAVGAGAVPVVLVAPDELCSPSAPSISICTLSRLMAVAS